MHKSTDCSQCTKNIDIQSTTVEATVCKESELPDNTMKVMKLKDHEILMIKQDGEIFAVGTKCTHYGAPLCKAALGKGRLRCQWHGACFNIRSGDIEDFPGLDSLPKYIVNVVNGDIVVKADIALLSSNRRSKPFTPRDPKDKTTFVVVGGGAAGNMCVQTLREEGFSGRIIFVCAESILPYDRVKLSKELSIKHAALELRCPHFFEERGIELLLGESMTSLNIDQNCIGVSSGRKLAYDKLFIATGGGASKLDVQGSDLHNIFTVRDLSDNERISHAIRPESEVVVIGGSFIAMEMSSALQPVVKLVTVISRGVPFKNIFGTAIAQRIMQYFEEKGVKFITEKTVSRFLGENKLLTDVVFDDSTKIKADICIMGVGTTFNTDFAKKTLKLQSDGGIQVDDYLKTSAKNVYAGGDVAYAPVQGVKANIGHWQIAHYHGKIAAFNMVGKTTKLNSVPFFWTTLFGKAFRYCGFAPNYKSVEIRGKLQDLKFVAFYIDASGIVEALLAVDKDPVASLFGEVLHRNERLKVTEIDSWLITTE